ncbi:hypothetical protein [Rhizobium sp. RU36D]|uniref:hypothetical protein n=1 Tax=Rhizobium sp. RU36D TaxID=1907415 RepID=UPI0009D8DD16|nr:hypothetical protein [Rhizobium sp. RU36D]SMD16325.1 hypothetical protein SAMN05880593_12942 [Rhizobium sp. RU36D]
MNEQEIIDTIRSYLDDASFDASISKEDEATLLDLSYSLRYSSFDFEGAEHYGAYANLIIAEKFFRRADTAFRRYNRTSLADIFDRLERQMIRIRERDTGHLEDLGRALADSIVTNVDTAMAA